jgi:hypothetical protein
MKKITVAKSIEERKIYTYFENGVVYVLQHLRNLYGFKPILRGYELSEYSSFYSREAIENALNDGKEILEFDTQKDFFQYFAKEESLGIKD